MKLTKLELSGFKSFADSVTLTFEDGVTAIVGPNGCGKSNVSDAVRWVLGEQSARLLRGGKMEDVIFQGSTARRPVNVTEVSLYLDNSDGDLPIAYREVVVTRRLSRSGQSDYLLNGSPVRLRDIQDLLRGTGLGSDAGVVIEAKMIDLLLSDRADERRIAVRGGRRHRPLSRPEAQHRAAPGGDRGRPPAGRGSDRRSPVPDPKPRPAARQGGAARQAHRREVRGAGDARAPPARAARRGRERHAGPVHRAGRGVARRSGRGRRVRAPARGLGPRRARRPRPIAPIWRGGWRRSSSSSAGSRAISPSPASAWPTPRRGGSAPAKSGPRCSCGPRARRWSSSRQRATARPRRSSTPGSGRSSPDGPRRRRRSAAGWGSSGRGCASGRRRCSDWPTRSARSRASGPPWMASSPRCGSGSPRPRPSEPACWPSWPTPSAAATAPSSGPGS